mmetsp:Transcript_106266/g.297481  ORF Transcript_106266/g.297481 Transcript_106266/m.297481 type:complete len:290 (+) Transcript_106266:104-973(+)
MDSTLSMVRRMLGRDSAAECKAHTEKLIASLQAEVDSLSGKAHHKARAAKAKHIAELRDQERYLDACRVVKGMAPLHGHFAAEAKGAAQPAPQEADGAEDAGLNPESAARLAAEATLALKRLEEATRHQRVSSGGDNVDEVDPELEDLRKEERLLVGRLAAQRKQSATGLNPSQAKEFERLLAEITERKASLRAQGLTEHEQDKDERVLLNLVRLAEIRQYERHEKKHERKERHEFEGIREEVERLRTKVDAHKKRLREEGIKSKSLKQDPQVGDLEERLATMQRMGGA